MRIIAGTAGGRRLFAPAGYHTRPTADRVKEAIFSVLMPYLPDARVLDAFAGSGAMALEALSRGAQEAVLIDHDKKALSAIHRNISLCGMAAATRVLSGDIVSVLPRVTGAFDLVFLDPPYNKGNIAKVEPLLLREGFLAPEAVIVLETAAKIQERFEAPVWQLWKESIYGDTAVLYYRYQKDQEEQKD